jgi:hypothetical protein
MTQKFLKFSIRRRKYTRQCKKHTIINKHVHAPTSEKGEGGIHRLREDAQTFG